MNAGKTLFAQIMEFVPWTSFSRVVARMQAGEITDVKTMLGLYQLRDRGWA